MLRLRNLSELFRAAEPSPIIPSQSNSTGATRLFRPPDPASNGEPAAAFSRILCTLIAV
jgi:hypothetical protein